jgi:hypothetical protein
MRFLKKEEKTKRGCAYCADTVKIYIRSHRLLCPYEECPYTVLDKHDTYEEFMKSKDSTINLGELLGNDGDQRRLTLSPKRCYSLRCKVYKRFF